MDATKTLIWACWGVSLVAPLSPVAGACLSYQSAHYIRRPWMIRLAVTLVFILLVNWILLATAMNHIHNLWIFNATVIPEFALSLWTLSGVGPQALPKSVTAPAMVGILAIASLQWMKLGPWAMWSMTILYMIAVLFVLCIWRLLQIIPIAVEDPDSWRPAFWLLGAWMLMFGVDLIFWPLHDYFLARLSKPLLLVPFLVKLTLNMCFNLALARTFLCRKSLSS